MTGAAVCICCRKCCPQVGRCEAGKEGQRAGAIERAGSQKVKKLFQCIQGEVVGVEVSWRGRIPMFGGEASLQLQRKQTAERVCSNTKTRRNGSDYVYGRERVYAAPGLLHWNSFGVFWRLKNVPRLGDSECLFIPKREMGNRLLSEPKECASVPTPTK
jgi:hypothetical protein